MEQLRHSPRSCGRPVRAKGHSARAGPAAGRRAAAVPRTTRRAVAEAPAGTPGITFALVLTAIIMILGVAVSFRAGGNEISGKNPRQLTGMFETMSNWFYGMGSKETVQKDIRRTVQPITDAHRAAVGTESEGDR